MHPRLRVPPHCFGEKFSVPAEEAGKHRKSSDFEPASPFAALYRSSVAREPRVISRQVLKCWFRTRSLALAYSLHTQLEERTEVIAATALSGLSQAQPYRPDAQRLHQM